MWIQMTRGARGEGGNSLSVGDVVDVSPELAVILIEAGRAITAPAPRLTETADIEDASHGRRKRSRSSSAL
jgi:predicted TIM-barrel fold metal-dependent hydrolase